MPRFFVENIIPEGVCRIEIHGPDARHIREVLRMAAGEALTVCDGARVDLQCLIEAFQGEKVVLQIQDRSRNETEPSFRATLYQGLPKGDKFDTIIQKCVELGIDRIVPVACERSIVKIAAADVSRKCQRWNRIAQEAAKQCGRGRIPEVTAPVRFTEAVDQVAAAISAGAIAFIPYEGEREQGLRRFLEQTLTEDGQNDAIASADGRGDSAGGQARGLAGGAVQSRLSPDIRFFIGPEGGFSPVEIATATTAGIQAVSLGRRILRTETASLAVLAMLGYHLSDF